ncbi:MAG: hypothetical protein KDI19_11065 [Pseudomonadales bacterium]|nr:hypothetical protein [Pseudomonadales bacterium]
MSGAISQIQVVYDPEEDRILFRLNSTEQQQFRFWLTRRYTILLLKVLAEHLDKDPDVTVQGTPTAREAVRSFKQEEAVRNANYAESFREDANELPLGQDVLTAYRLSYSVKNGILHLGIQPKEGQGINMAINQEINSSFTQLLLGAAGKGEWKLDSKDISIQPAGQDNIVIN